MSGQGTTDEPMGEVPEDANENCPGTEAEMAGKAAACEGCPNQQICATAPKGPDPDAAAISARMSTVRHKVLVLSGKGGVGKSTVSAQLAFALASSSSSSSQSAASLTPPSTSAAPSDGGRQVGLLDVDICGPSIPKMLGLEGQEIHQSAMGWSPVYVDDGLGVMSIGFLLPNPDEAVVWRGPRKNGLIKQFLKDVDWGNLDYLIVDAPPGTSDEHISIAQYLKATGVDGAVIVTTPQEVSVIDVRKEISFCKKVGIRVLGVVENMSGFQQRLDAFRFRRPRNPAVAAANGHGAAGAVPVEDEDVTEQVLGELRRHAPWVLDTVACTNMFHVSGGGGEAMAREMEVPFLGRIPFDPSLSQAAEEGRSLLADFAGSPSSLALQAIIKGIVAAVEGN